MKSAYNDHINRISDILDKKVLSGISVKGGIEDGENGGLVREGSVPTSSSSVQSQLPILFGLPKGYKSVPTIGPHPDFYNIKFGDKRYQYCTSMFIDIKGSTNLAISYSLEQVRLMKDAILSLCIQTVTVFGGHIQRLQGDGLYVQFSGLNIHQNDMIINALNAASVLCQFISTTLADVFIKRSLKPLRIKIGIDFAEKEKCLWSHYGLPRCNELTATSLHVDLAAKLQARCASNEIRIGHNVREYLDLPSEFFHIPQDSDGKEDEFIKHSIGYRQYVFDWSLYLLMFDFVHKGNHRLEIEPPVFKLSCSFYDESGSENQYYQNNGSIPKGYKLKFVLMRNGSIYSKTPHDSITWRIVNRGIEASKANNTEEILDGYKNQTSVVVNSAYLGHHYMECIVKRSYESFNHRIKFGVYVR